MPSNKALDTMRPYKTTTVTKISTHHPYTKVETGFKTCPIFKATFTTPKQNQHSTET
ncbi:MAG: hypothetical protein K8R77_12710 [Anaerolineaceae bacterium]|nr:hypothetical protein [Anaerolineaceae bacterium]